MTVTEKKDDYKKKMAEIKIPIDANILYQLYQAGLVEFRFEPLKVQIESFDSIEDNINYFAYKRYGLQPFQYNMMDEVEE